MNNLRGERFTLNLSDDEDDERGSPSNIPKVGGASISSAFIGDIKEREPAPPSTPKLKTTATGFPEHKKRTRTSAFKQQRSGLAKPSAVPEVTSPAIERPATSTSAPAKPRNIQDDERQRINDENNQRLAAMSIEDIEEERQELMASLDPSLVERLLKRANLDQGRGDTGLYPPEELKQMEKDEAKIQNTTSSTATDATAAPPVTGKRILASKSVTWEDDEPAEPIALQPTSQATTEPLPEMMQDSIHFPAAPAAPDLDPADPSFLENLHSKYFPNLPADPSKLAWMAPLPTRGSVADQESPYYPENEALPASAIRFDFRGGILPPRISRAMPSTKGLHHHGEAPEAAGYTVPELARLARSAFPAQRCIAFQTLGRLLYRLGRGEWGDEDHEITKGLWRCMEEGKVVQTLEEASAAEGGHQGSKMYAVEALWLWQKGGGKVWKAS